jgi:cysteine desulfurase/selenocysteine lyase
MDYRKDFPILNREINGKPLVYLDNAATSQKPRAVIEAIVDYYSSHNANVHRGIHTLSEEATQMYEDSREKVAKFINATTSEEVIFTRGTTDGLNFIASTLGNDVVEEGDTILLTEMEHHSNLVPWQQVALNKKAKLEYVQVTETGEIDFADFEKKISKGVKIVAFTHASNVVGTIFPIKEISKIAHQHGALVIIDGAQAIPHMPVNIQSLGCDVYAFSGHKMMGPTGIGVLWVKREILSKLEPYQFGGGMIEEVELTKSTWANDVSKFEAGTPNVEGAVGLAAAIDYLSAVGMDVIQKHEVALNKYAIEQLQKIDGLKIFGPLDAEKRAGLVAFYITGTHPHDVAAVLNNEGIAVRSGHHCAHPLHRKLNVTASVRASFYLYNNEKDVDRLVEGLKKAKEILS